MTRFKDKNGNLLDLEQTGIVRELIRRAGYVTAKDELIQEWIAGGVINCVKGDGGDVWQMDDGQRQVSIYDNTRFRERNR